MWELAHKVAAPSWTVGALALLLGGVVAFGASGWAWLWVAVAIIASVALIGVGSAMGAHTVAVLDAQQQAEESNTSCSCGGGDASQQPSKPVAVDIDAARRAAQAADS